MGYHVVDPADVEPMEDRPSETRSISDAVGLENLGVRVYEVAPGEDIPYAGLHYHDEQEELFYVVDGELSVETPERDFQVERGEFFVVEPGNAHRAYNPDVADTNARVVAVGAPAVRDGHRFRE